MKNDDTKGILMSKHIMFFAFFMLMYINSYGDEAYSFFDSQWRNNQEEINEAHIGDSVTIKFKTENVPENSVIDIEIWVKKDEILMDLIEKLQGTVKNGIVEIDWVIEFDLKNMDNENTIYFQEKTENGYIILDYVFIIKYEDKIISSGLLAILSKLDLLVIEPERNQIYLIIFPDGEIIKVYTDDDGFIRIRNLRKIGLNVSIIPIYSDEHEIVEPSEPVDFYQEELDEHETTIAEDSGFHESPYKPYKLYGLFGNAAHSDPGPRSENFSVGLDFTILRAPPGGMIILYTLQTLGGEYQHQWGENEPESIFRIGYNFFGYFMFFGAGVGMSSFYNITNNNMGIAPLIGGSLSLHFIRFNYYYRYNLVLNNNKNSYHETAVSISIGSPVLWGWGKM
jgi:hypothetical protein